jgi:uncharacterized protein
MTGESTALILSANLQMKSSMFNLRVPLPARDEVFLMNTLTDAQLVVSTDVAALLDRMGETTLDSLDGEEREALDLLWENGFLVQDRETDRQNLDQYLAEVKSDTAELNVTLLTTLQCNFACDYCFQGDHGDYNERADRMSLDTARQTIAWMTRELDRVHPGKFVLTFFGGEPLLNLPAMYEVAERMWEATQARQVPMYVNIITNGLLLTPDVVDRMLPFGLNGVKITLDGDRDTHNRMRPLRGGQGTFDRIVENVRKVAHKCRIAIGGNFDESSVDSYPALLEFLKQQDFADKLSKVFFKPVFRVEPVSAKGIIPLTPIAAKDKLNGTCMTSVGSGAGKACDSCNVLDDKLTFLRQETKRLGFPTHDGVHNGPCHVHKQHAHTIGPDGSLYACPGFTGQLALSTGHIDDRKDSWRESALERFNRLHPWKECGDCAFIPVCAGGCVAASYSQLGDVNTPTCHKHSFESALISLAHTAASAA